MKKLLPRHKFGGLNRHSPPTTTELFVIDSGVHTSRSVFDTHENTACGKDEVKKRAGPI